MKKTNTTIPAASKLNLLRQVGNFIPDCLGPKLARAPGAQAKARPFGPWSHRVSLLSAQLAPRIGLDDGGAALALPSGPLSSLRGATPPNRNTLSHANKERPAAMAEALCGAVFEPWGNGSPAFVSGQAGKRFARQFKRTIHLVDSTTIPLIASCMDWANHRRRQAAAKCHLRPDRQSCRPRFAIGDPARHNGARRAREVCAGVTAGEIVILDRAYVHFEPLADRSMREVFWGPRAKENSSCRGGRCFQHGAAGRILRDDLIQLQTPTAPQDCPVAPRRIVARVEVDGREGGMEFLTTNLDWSAGSIADLYRCRGPIEGFFKPIKQTLPLAAFLGTSANAGRWQVWPARLVYRLLRYRAFLSNWSHSCSRRFTRLRAVVWKKWDALSLLRR